MRYSVSRLVALFVAAATAMVCGAALRGMDPSTAESLAQDWDYVPAMQQLARGSRALPGVVLHVGDSITYSNPYGQWARHGEGQTDQDRKVLKWMHAGQDDDQDGWWLCRFDHPAGGRSYTACSGIRADELLAGGKQGLPSLAAMVEKYHAQIVVLMVGTNDASAGRAVDDYRADIARMLDEISKRGAICILSTLPPHPGQKRLAADYNQALRELARERSLPLIDYEREILRRRPDDWNGTLLSTNDVHPSVGNDPINAASAPTDENLRASGYLLRGWLSVQKIAEVKRTVLDGLARDAVAPEAGADTKGRATQPKVQAPTGEPIRVPIVRDTWFSNVGQEADCNLGGATQLKLKSVQEMSLVDFDPAPLRGRVIQGATLHLRVRGEEILHRVTVSSFAAEWVEGTATSYEPRAGSSTHNSRKHPDVPWAFPGSDLNAVMLGQGGTQWRMADAVGPDDDGWQRVAVEPIIVALRVANISHGLFLFDDTGTEWTRQGEAFTSRLYPNRFVHSRESGEDNAPYLTVWLGPDDHLPPAVPTDLKTVTRETPAGEAWVAWTTPSDEGEAGTVGFVVSVNGQEVSHYLVPAARGAGETVEMHVRDLGLKPGDKVKLQVRAVDGAGNIGDSAKLDFVLASGSGFELPGKTPEYSTAKAPLPKLGQADVAILDELDKVHPVRGTLIPEQPAGYLAANHLWNAKAKRVTLSAARNEFVAFQILFHGTARDVKTMLSFGKDGFQPEVTFSRYWHVDTKGEPLPDPIVPLTSTFSVPSADEAIDGQKYGSLLCEIYVPHDAGAGRHQGQLRLRAGKEELEIPVVLEVWDFTLPDSLSFLPEMNCYGLPENERDYYRLAHRHRTVINRVPYHQNGRMSDGCAPDWDGNQLDWGAWDQRFGPYFDGTAFDDLPRRRVPLELFYLPLHENWPSPMEGNYNGDYWADRAFPGSYRQAFVEASRQFAAHCNQRGWNETLFLCFQNNKNNFKSNGWSRGSSPWLLDEPASFQDYWALRFFAQAFHEGVALARGSARMLYRADISRPQWQRNSLDGLLDYNVVAGGAFRQYHRLVLDRQLAEEHLTIEYGSSNALDQSNMQPLGWCLDAWCLSSIGVLPWQTIGTDDSWLHGDELSLFYPGAPRGQTEPIPSIRLKAYRRGQQDVEYLTLLQQQFQARHDALANEVREALHLKGRLTASGFVGGEDAGRIQFSQLLPQDAWKLRQRIGSALSQRAPAAQARLVEMRTPPRDSTRLAPGYVSVGEVDIHAAPPNPRAEELQSSVLQGPEVVQDTILDPQQADQNFGGQPRDNRLLRTELTNAFLVRFALDKLSLPAEATVRRATLSFFVWDPSSRGKTKVVASPILTAWDASQATWTQPSRGKSWRGKTAFDPDQDGGTCSKSILVLPDAGDDIADPPIEYQLDVTDAVQQWRGGKLENHGLALCPQVDRAVDEGQFTRFQVLASEYSRVEYTPKLTVEWVP